MNNKNAKIYKFPRKQMQVSEEINNKKHPKELEKQRQSKKIIVVTKEDVREKPNPTFLEELEEQGERDGEANVPRNGKVSKGSTEKDYKSEQFMRMSEKGVLFEKKLTKIVMPEQYQRYKYVHKLQNKLMNCLEKKKPLIPMKKLVHVEMLNDILNKKERKIVTNRPNYIEKLDVQAQSLRKIEERTESSGDEIVQSKEPLDHGEQKFKLKLLPLRVPTFKEEQHFFHPEQTSNFIFEQADNEQFAFFNEQSSSFDALEKHYEPHYNDVFKKEEKGSNPFKKINNHNSIFSQMDQYSYNKNVFNKEKPQKNNGMALDIAKIKIPKIDNKRGKAVRKQKSNEFNIFSIEQEQSIFFPEQNSIYDDNNDDKPQNKWEGKEYRSESSFSSHLYY